MAKRYNQKIYKLIAEIIGIILFITVWYLVSMKINSFLLPTPMMVFKKIIVILSNFTNSEISITLYRIAISLSLSIIIGISIGIIASFNQYIYFTLRPIISILLGMPPIIWVILSLFWFDLGNASVIFTITIVTLPICFSATIKGIITIDKNLKEMLVFFNLPLSKRIRVLYLPHIINYMIPSLIITIASGIKVSIMAELLAANSGIGFKISEARTMLETTDIFAYVTIVLIIIIFVEYILLEPILKFIQPITDYNVRAK